MRALVWLAGVCLATVPGLLSQAPAPVAPPMRYRAPQASAQALAAVDFAEATDVDPQLTVLYGACDANQGRGGCYSDQAHNTAVLRFGDGTVFYDAKMAIDADGSTLSKRAEHPNQPETSFRYPGVSPTPTAPDAQASGPGPSLDAERVPYIVMPLGDFRRESGIALGDIAVVVKDNNVQFAIVGDLGPRTHIGEASMRLHMQFGRKICTTYDPTGNCSTFTDTSLDAPVLYFLFPDTRKLLIDGLNAANIDERITAVGKQVWTAFLERQQQARERNP